MTGMYKGVVNLSDGTTIEVTGTFPELANWADNIIREHAGEITINIRETK